MVKVMRKTRRKRLSLLERLCVRRFYLTDGHLINQCSSDYFKSLGIEKGLEVILKLAEEEPILMKVIARDEDNFMIFIDEEMNGKFSPLFEMKSGIQEL